MQSRRFRSRTSEEYDPERDPFFGRDRQLAGPRALEPQASVRLQGGCVQLCDGLLGDARRVVDGQGPF